MRWFSPVAWLLVLACSWAAAAVERPERFLLGETVYEVGQPSHVVASGDVTAMVGSPDGRWLAVVRRGKGWWALGLLDQGLRSGELLAVTALPPPESPRVFTIGPAGDMSDPVWSPAGDALLVATRLPPPDPRMDVLGRMLWLVPVSGEPRCLATTAGLEKWGWLGGMVYYSVADAEYPGKPEGGVGGFFVVDPRTGATRRLAAGTDRVQWNAAAGTVTLGLLAKQPDGYFGLAWHTFDPATGQPVGKPVTDQRIEPVPAPDPLVHGTAKLEGTAKEPMRSAHLGKSDVVLVEGEQRTPLTEGGDSFPLGWLPGGQAALWGRVVSNRDDRGRPHPASLQLWLSPTAGKTRAQQVLLADSFSLSGLGPEVEQTVPRCFGGERVVYLDHGDLVAVSLTKTELKADDTGFVADPGVASTLVSNAKQLGLAAHMYAQDNDETFPSGDWTLSLDVYIRDHQVFDLPGYLGQPAFEWLLPPGAALADMANAARVPMLQSVYGPYTITTYADGHVSVEGPPISR